MNAITISNTSSKYGNLALVVTIAIYDSHDVVGCVAPDNPGATPDYKRITDNTSITEDNRQHVILKQDYSTWHEIYRALKILLLAAVPHTFIQ